MSGPAIALVAFACVVLLLVGPEGALAATVDLGNGFRDHGVATPVSNHRGTVATVDGEGRNVVLVWLFDHRGGYALLMIDAQTGEAEEHPMPFPPGGDCPYASILSSRNKFYTHFNGHFVEFDPAERDFTFFAPTARQMAMSMTEDDNGVIWSVTYPQSGLASFNPETREFRDYGHVYTQNWPQYQRSIAVDDAGWIYFAVGNTLSQIIAFDPETETARPILAETERVQGSAYVYRDLDGKVYGLARSGQQDTWMELYRGERREIGVLEQRRPKAFIAGSQGLFHRRFPDGKRLVRCDTVERIMVVEDPETEERVELSFDYSSEGAHIMGVATAPGGIIAGGTAFPMRAFTYDPATDEWTNRASYGQWNTVARQGDRFFVGGYTAGFLLEWDPAQEWVPTVKGQEGCNPQFLTDCAPTINRPHALLAHPDGKTLVLAGTPGYGYTGGGLLLWDRETRTRVLLEHTDILPQHSTMSLVALPDRKLLGGTTTAPGTGGEKRAEQAELYIMDMETKQVEWHEPVFPGVQSYTDMCMAPNGLVLGFADRRRFFVFDPATRQVVHEAETSAELGATTSQQGPRVFVRGDDESIYILFVKGIAQVDPETFEITMLAESPVPIGLGGDYLDGRIYFGRGSRMYSYTLPEPED